MSPHLPLSCSALAVALVGVFVGGCSTFDAASQKVAGVITPYKVEILQGNFISNEQVQALRSGMSRLQVRDILGSPLVASVFHADRWDYVFTLRRQGSQVQTRKLTVFFRNDLLDRFDGDTMPSEVEFVAGLDSGRSMAKPKPLIASEETLKPYQAPPAPPKPVPTAPVRTTPYPPLEPSVR